MDKSAWPAEIRQWESQGQYLKTALFGHRVFWRQLGKADAAPERTLLLLHGFPESSFSYHKVVDGLARVFERVVLFDFPGYGLSDKPLANYTYSLFEQADTALEVWHQLGVRGGHLLSHDMGDSVATELVARHVSTGMPGWFAGGFQSFTFTNGNMAMDLAALRLGQRILLNRVIGPLASRVASYRALRQTVLSAQGNDRLDERDIELLWANITLQDGHRRNHRVIQYLRDRFRFEKTRWLPSLAKVKQPVHICWGDADAVSPARVARHLQERWCPQAKLTLMPGAGHFCQLSDPGVWLESITAFYAR